MASRSLGSGLRSAAAAMLLVLAWAACASQEAACSACGRQECANLTTTVAWEKGGEDRTCCPRCALHLVAARGEGATVSVRDFESAVDLPAEQALFVEGSDLNPCRGVTTSPPRNAHGCCLAPAYDRCEPSLMAFADAEAARRFMARPGGMLTDWAALQGAAGSSASPGASSGSGPS